MMTLTKHPGDQFWVDLDFSTWPTNAGETVVASNARGALGVVIRDSNGADVSASMVESAQVNGTKVKWLLKGGAAGTYAVTVTAPTSDGELLSDTGAVRVY